ncbi:hypothetical protein CPB86DRAFT_179480 [Serendipita vermifera]|nr:hypothetical protein CPB86DRAFT_179480 [Serendipita vermifera]
MVSNSSKLETRFTFDFLSTISPATFLGLHELKRHCRNNGHKFIPPPAASLPQDQVTEPNTDHPPPPPYHLATAAPSVSPEPHLDTSMAIGQSTVPFSQFGGFNGSQIARTNELYPQPYVTPREVYANVQGPSQSLQYYQHGAPDASCHYMMGLYEQQPHQAFPVAQNTAVQYGFHVPQQRGDYLATSLSGAVGPYYYQPNSCDSYYGASASRVTQQVSPRRVSTKTLLATSLRGFPEGFARIFQLIELADAFEIVPILDTLPKPWIMTDQRSDPIGLAFRWPMHKTCMMLFVSQWDLVWYRSNSNPYRHNYNTGSSLSPCFKLVFPIYRIRALLSTVSSFSSLFSTVPIELDSPSSDNGLYQCSGQETSQSVGTRVHCFILFPLSVFSFLRLLTHIVILCSHVSNNMPHWSLASLPIFLPYVSTFYLSNHSFIPSSLERAYGSTVLYSCCRLKRQCDRYLCKPRSMTTPPRCSLFSVQMSRNQRGVNTEGIYYLQDVFRLLGGINLSVPMHVGSLYHRFKLGRTSEGQIYNVYESY